MSIDKILEIKWRDLTYDEIEQAWQSVDYTKPWDVQRIDVARAIEANFKKKNAHKLLTDDQIKRLIVEYGREFHSHDAMPEVCRLVSYHPDIGRVPEHWEPHWHVFAAVRYVMQAANAIQGDV